MADSNRLTTHSLIELKYVRKVLKNIEGLNERNIALSRSLLDSTLSRILSNLHEPASLEPSHPDKATLSFKMFKTSFYHSITRRHGFYFLVLLKAALSVEVARYASQMGSNDIFVV